MSWSTRLSGAFLLTSMMVLALVGEGASQVGAGLDPQKPGEPAKPPDKQPGPAVKPPFAQLRAGPRLEPIADVRLLMRGINWPNFKGIEGLLTSRPADADSWSQIRGGALLIAENGNLLMLRPPRNQPEDRWLDRAVDLRSTAARLARAASDHQYERARASLIELAKTCNRCHQSSQVAVVIQAFEKGPYAPPSPPAIPQPPQPPPPPKPPTPPGERP